MNGQNVSVFRVSRWMLIFATATFAIITASPLVWMVSASLKEPAEIFKSSLIPQHPTLENFRYVSHNCRLFAIFGILSSWRERSL